VVSASSWYCSHITSRLLTVRRSEASSRTTFSQGALGRSTLVLVDVVKVEKFPGILDADSDLAVLYPAYLRWRALQMVGDILDRQMRRRPLPVQFGC
jgi:hypothetical protein